MTETPPPSSSPETDNGNGPVRAMVVGASDVVAGLVADVLKRDPRIEVAARPADGEEAVVLFRNVEVEAVIIDIGGEPKDSLTAISRLLRIDAKAEIIMVSTLNFTNVRTGMEGLERGAQEFMQTPAPHTRDSSLTVFQHNLTETVHGLGLARRRAGGRLAKKPPARPGDQPIALRPASSATPEILLIGSSTGGPQALQAVFKTLSRSIPQPVLITQHMPPIFTAALATGIAEKSGWACKEGEDGEIIRPGHAYVAPGDKHMIIEKDGGETVIRINQDPPENYCRPSVDPLFRSAVKIFGAATLATVLTGMGNDGEAGGRLIAEAGGTVIAQDETTSVVWGMPGAVAMAGVCSAVLPLGEIAAYLNEAAGAADGKN